MKTIKVLQVNIDDSGGAFSLMYQVQKQLESKVVFDYYTMSRFRNVEVVDSIGEMGGKVYEAKIRQNRLVGHFKLPFLFFAFLKNSNYRVIHVHADTAWKILLYALPAKMVGIDKIVAHSHSSGVNGDYRCLKKFLHYIAKMILPVVCTELLSCSDKATEWMYCKKYQKKAIIVHNGVDTSKYLFNEKERNILRNSLSLTDEDVLIGTVGDFSYQKNPHFLIDVISEVRKSNNNVFGIFVGDGNERYKAEKYAKEKGIANAVFFWGKAYNVECLYSAMDIYAMPSRGEGFPVSAIEAQISGLKCVFSDKITREVKLLNNCEFADIGSVQKWCKCINDYILLRSLENRLMLGKSINAGKHNIACAADEVLRVYLKRTN